MSGLRPLVFLGLFVLLLPACRIEYPETCSSATPVGLTNANEIASDDSLPFRFPLDESFLNDSLDIGWFGVFKECPPDIEGCYENPERQYHAAEDYKSPGGIPVYAMAL